MMVWPFSSTPLTSSPSQPASNPTPKEDSISQLPPQPQPTPAKNLTRDEIADLELKSFLSSLEAEAAPTPPSSKPKYTRLPSTRTATSTILSNNESISEHVLPITMSCRQAFDAAFYCNSFGGRFNDLYRYGTLRSCSESWNDFWFCMKTRTYSDKAKEEVIKAHYREKERRKYGGDGKEEKGDGLGEGVGVTGYRGRGSEDVWRSRDILVKEGTAFREPIVGWERGGSQDGDGEWNERERQQRRLDAERLSK